MFRICLAMMALAVFAAAPATAVVVVEEDFEDDVVDDPETLMKTREGTRDVEDVIAEGNDLII